jgi:hypothetical protein
MNKASPLTIASLNIANAVAVKARTTYYNKVDLLRSPAVIVETMLIKGLVINLHSKVVSHYIRNRDGGSTPVYKIVSGTVSILPTEEQASTLVDVLIAKGDFVTVDLSDTQIFRTVWTRFGWQSNADKKLFLVLTSADSNGYEEWVKKINKKKNRISFAGVVLMAFLVFPVSIPLLVVGKRLTCDKAQFRWKEIFNLAGEEDNDLRPDCVR